MLGGSSYQGTTGSTGTNPSKQPGGMPLPDGSLIPNNRLLLYSADMILRKLQRVQHAALCHLWRKKTCLFLAMYGQSPALKTGTCSTYYTYSNCMSINHRRYDGNRDGPLHVI